MNQGPSRSLWLFTGIPGSGKTTTARSLAKRLPRSVHIEGDRLFDLVVSGKVGPGEQPPEEADAQIEMNIDNQCALARRCAEAGFVPVVDFVVADRNRLDRYRNQLPGWEIRFVALVPAPQIALGRDHRRSEKTVGPQWVHLDKQIRDEFAGLGSWIDNGDMTVEQVVDRLLKTDVTVDTIR